MAQPLIQLKNISVNFKNKERDVLAVDNVNLDIQRGDIFGIVGYSGAGKSTLVRVINLLQRPTGGEVLINGEDICQYDAPKLRQTRKKIGMIFQHFNLMMSRTIAQNVAYALKGSPLSKQEKQDKVNELLDLVGLADKKDTYPRQLSGGQKQRVAIARSLANDPDILISDEATSALDPKTTESILNLLQELNKKLNLTVVLITHQMEAVKQISNKVAVMEQGKVIERGSVLDIFATPKTSLTQSFIDTTTRLDATLKGLAQQDNLKHLKPGEQLVQLSYSGDTTDEPIIVSLYQKFGVSANILYGNVEILQGTPIGSLIVILSGDAIKVSESLEFLTQSGVRIKKLNLADFGGDN
ncbi:methionine ABC transporter ATP-binding protein [Holzapfeliella floricola]|uniref:ABC-type metal ion transport system, ATPase component n=1 Tax=Holzapfeliella floricola DSM 23037 = JCM 16512 TaxID=1423744 RepID=A0A0R2DJ33_9LACO|nr:methionine ABC transporter ATP-binding protein [Holzapfeliella floricola]KRN04104.1 ABC-type metal ion transport system, ATPase component [Holzapfeliella floricola DSM 23037 = JCM 16512]